jgi:GNAT superfamily N-acetyltransferase
VHDEPEFRIEPAREHDAPVILRMIKALADYERLSHEFAITESILRQAVFGTHPVAEVVLGYAGTEPVGFAVYFPTFSTAPGHTGLYLEDLFVEPQWRGRGFGRKLLAHVAKVAAARGCRELNWSVLTWNELAIRFYRSLGADLVEDSVSFRLTGRALNRLVGDMLPEQLP